MSPETFLPYLSSAAADVKYCVEALPALQSTAPYGLPNPYLDIVRSLLTRASGSLALLVKDVTDAKDVASKFQLPPPPPPPQIPKPDNPTTSPEIAPVAPAQVQ